MTVEEDRHKMPAPLLPPSYQKQFTFEVRPTVISWITVVALGLIPVLWFFDWVGAYPGGYAVYSQNAFQLSVGGLFADPVGDEVMQKDGEIRANISGNFLLIFYFLASLIALALAAASFIFGAGSSRLLPTLQRIWPYRLGIIEIGAALALVILLFEAWTGFGLEGAVAKVADAKLEHDRSAARTPEKNQKVDIKRGEEIGRFALERTNWYRLAVLCHLVAVVAAGIQLGVNRSNRPLPQVTIQW
jgi:hypothetical protein